MHFGKKYKIKDIEEKEEKTTEEIPQSVSLDTYKQAEKKETPLVETKKNDTNEVRTIEVTTNTKNDASDSTEPLRPGTEEHSKIGEKGDEIRAITPKTAFLKAVNIKELKKNHRHNKEIEKKIPGVKKVKSNTAGIKTLPEDLKRYDPDILVGLNTVQVAERNAQQLNNKNKITNSKTYAGIICSNIFTFFNLIELAIAVALLVFGHYTQSYFLWVAILNTIIGIVQEIRAKNTIAKLKLVTAQNVKVVRNSKTEVIPTDQLVLDDIYVLNNGDQIPTDSVIKDGTMEVNESLLTGESLPIKKGIGDTILAGSFVVSGSAIVQAKLIGDYNYASGIQAKAKEFSKPKSELMRSLNTIIRVISLIIIPLGGALFFTQWMHYAIQTDL